MSETIRFPYNRNLPIAASEATQIITILPAKTGTLALGGEQSYVSIAPWKTADESTAAPYACIALEFRGTIAGTIGNGTSELIGLYGQVNLVTTPTTNAQRQRQLIAVLGLQLGLLYPQIVIVRQSAPASDLVGTTILASNIAVYDQLSIGGVTGAVTIPEGMTFSVVARPIRRKDFIG
jgi:hypothetical protein